MASSEFLLSAGEFPFRSLTCASNNALLIQTVNTYPNYKVLRNLNI